MPNRQLTRRHGVQIARKMKKKLLSQGIPLKQVFIFGSVATGNIHEWSDLDLAFVCEPFASSRHAETVYIAQAREDFDIPMDIICLHPADLTNPCIDVVQDIKTHGISA